MCFGAVIPKYNGMPTDFGHNTLRTKRYDTQATIRAVSTIII